MAKQRIALRLPVEGFPQAVLETDYSFAGGRLLVDGAPLLAVASREALLDGAVTRYRGRELKLGLIAGEGVDRIELTLDGRPAFREDRLSRAPSRSAWLHGLIALAASGFGFAASYLYLAKAQSLGDPWALKMAIHMFGWHLLLTVALFPASVWGQRFGIRAVQGMSVLFFAIHAGIAIANGVSAIQDLSDVSIAVLNALSGLSFAAAVAYGQTAHRDMDPLPRVMLEA